MRWRPLQRQPSGTAQIRRQPLFTISQVALLTLGVFVPLLACFPAPAQDPSPTLARPTQLADAGKCLDAQREIAAIPDSTREADQARYAVAECFVKHAEWKQAQAILQLLTARSPAYNPALFL